MKFYLARCRWTALAWLLCALSSRHPHTYFLVSSADCFNIRLTDGDTSQSISSRWFSTDAEPRSHGKCEESRASILRERRLRRRRPSREQASALFVYGSWRYLANLLPRGRSSSPGRKGPATFSMNTSYNIPHLRSTGNHFTLSLLENCFILIKITAYILYNK